MLPEDIQELISNVNEIAHEMTAPIYDTISMHKKGKEADLEIFLSAVRIKMVKWQAYLPWPGTALSER